jgi:hypothetical protein
MNGAAPTTAPAVTVRIAVAVLLPAEATSPEAEQPESDPAAHARIVDPYYILARSATAGVNVRLSSAEEPIRLDLPHTEPDEMYELLETLYLLGGWPAVDSVYEQVQRSLVRAVVDVLGLPRDELNAITSLVNPTGPLYIPPNHVELAAQAVGALIAVAEQRTWPGVIAGLKAVVPVNGLFAPASPHAETSPPVAANAEVAARFFAEVLRALHAPRAAIVKRIIDVLTRAERETSRLILMTLTDSHAEILREGARYFAFKKDSIEQALRLLTHYPVATKGGSAQAKDSALAEEPEALQKAVKTLVPLARDVLKLERAKKSPLGRAPPSTVKAIDPILQRKRAVFAHELGRQAQQFPVLSQLKVEMIERTAGAGGDLLGTILFGILKHAHTANDSMRARAEGFASAVNVLGHARHPEKEVAAAARDLGKGRSIWSYPKYVERAAERVTNGDELGRKALDDAITAVAAGSGEMAKQLAQGAGEMIVLHAASKFTARLVPVMNVALAAWHISTAVQDFKGEDAEFYCALDPRDALIEAAPSFASLAADVVTEAAFAII